MKRVVVIGGGFAGSMVARKLMNKCDVTLVDAEDFFEYTPGILRVLVEPKHYHELYAKHADYLPNVKIIVGHVDNIYDKRIALAGRKLIDYDYLVIASGSSYSYPIKEKNIFFKMRIKNLLDANKKIKRSKRIIVVGGGVVGVELASELATCHNKKKITLVHSGNKLMDRNNSKTSEYAKRFLQKNGVKIIFNEKIVKTVGKKLIGESGEKYSFDSVFFTVGIKPNVNFMNGSFSRLVSKGVIVNNYLQVEGKKNIFAAGDVSNIMEEKTAQNAEKHGEIVANNILADINGKEMVEYKSKKRMMVISLGKKCGIVEYKSFVMTGWIPALMKYMIEKIVMNSLK